MSRKKRLLFHSDFSLAKTGFGRNARAILSYLYPKDKYDILHYCCGLSSSHQLLSMTPWRSIGTLPDSTQVLRELKRNEGLYKMSSYGKDNLDEVVRDFKPDVYIAIQDIWGVDFAVEKDWFNKATSVIWTTLDSLPILPSAVELAPKIKNYWVWSSFAEKALHELGHSHVKTVHGAVESKYFQKINEDSKLFKAKKGLNAEDFIIGFVFRNQLRKSVPNLIQGFKLFKEQDPQSRYACKLLLHTSFNEGWNIMKLAAEHGVHAQDILCTYVCHVCKSYRVANYEGEGKHCFVCGNQSSMTTPTVDVGVQEFQLNEIYNLMDVYVHPFTSGGQEVPIQEAKMSELITLVTNYSCGEEMCSEEAHSLALDWSEYREHSTEFRKASTEPESIAEQLAKVFNMSPEDRAALGRKGRDWALKEFATDKVGSFIEQFIDDSPFVDESIYVTESKQDPDAKIDMNLSNAEWVRSLYKQILDKKIDNTYEGFKYWMRELEKSDDLDPSLKKKQRVNIEMFFKRTALEQLEKNIENFLDDDDKGKRILFVMPQAATEIFLATSLFPSAKKMYPDYNIYVSADKSYQSMFHLNPYVHKFIPYNANMENVFFLEGSASHEGHFELAFLPFSTSRNAPYFHHNGKDKLDFKIKV